jgi:hypothetical protein
MEQDQDQLPTFDDIDLDELTEEELSEALGGDPQLVIPIPRILC